MLPKCEKGGTSAHGNTRAYMFLLPLRFGCGDFGPQHLPPKDSMFDSGQYIVNLNRELVSRETPASFGLSIGSKQVTIAAFITCRI